MFDPANRKKRTMKLKKSALIEKLVEEINTFTDEETSNKAKTEIARETVNIFFNSLKESLATGDRVEIRGARDIQNQGI
jgi:nucleoid DNA-binding protein